MRLHVVSGSSRGLGAALVAHLLQPGDTVLGLARQQDGALTGLAAARGARLEQWRVDLSEPAAVAERLLVWLREHDGAACERAVLINNAATVHAPLALRDAGFADLALTLRVGLEAATLLSAAFLRGTRDWPGERRVLNISSGLGRRAMASSAAYAAAKAGLDHLSRCLALEEAALPNGAKVLSLAPGVIDTGMQLQLRSASAADFPDVDKFVAMHRDGQLQSADAAAARVLARLDRPDFGAEPVGDVRE